MTGGVDSLTKWPYVFAVKIEKPSHDVVRRAT
jgi:hypothetical protein